jgi:hypothetical protein
MHGGVTDKGARQGRVKVPQFEGVADAQHNYVTPIQAGSLLRTSPNCINSRHGTLGQRGGRVNGNGHFAPHYIKEGG